MPASVLVVYIHHAVNVYFPGRVRSGVISIYVGRGQRVSFARCRVIRRSTGAPGAHCDLDSTPFSPFTPQGFGVTSVAKALLEHLGDAALGAGVDRAFGSILSALGVEGGELTRIEGELKEINTRLAEIQKQLTELRLDVLQGNCNGTTTDLKPIVSNTNALWDRYVSLANASAKDRKIEAQALLKDVAAKNAGQGLDPWIREIDDGLAHPAPLTTSVIQECGKLVQAQEGRFVTSASSTAMQDVLEYWQLYETKLVTLEVESLHAQKRNAAALDLINRAKGYLGTENSTLKQPIWDGEVLDGSAPAGCPFRGCRFVWWRYPPEVADGYSQRQWGIAGLNFLLPSSGQLFSLLTSCCDGVTATQWLTDQAHIDWARIDGADWSALRNLGDPNGGFRCDQFGGGGFRRDADWTPVVWTTTAPSNDQKGIAYLCDHSDPGAGYGIALPLGSKMTADELRNGCDEICGYPLRLPGVLWPVATVRACDYLYAEKCPASGARDRTRAARRPRGLERHRTASDLRPRP